MRKPIEIAREIIEAAKRETKTPQDLKERLELSVFCRRRDLENHVVLPDGTKPRKMHPHRRKAIEDAMILIERYVGMFLAGGKP